LPDKIRTKPIPASAGIGFLAETPVLLRAIWKKYTKSRKLFQNNHAKSRKMVDNDKGIVYDLFIGSFPIE
jgi:hypothetical protein